MSEKPRLYRLEQLQEKLYSKKEGSSLDETQELEQHTISVPTDWGTSIPGKNHDEILTTQMTPARKKKRGSLATKFLLGALLLLAGAGGYTYYAYQGGFKPISSDNIDIEVVGPLSVSAGEPLVLDVRITNTNDVYLEAADILFEYPDGTRTADESSQKLQRTREVVGVIESGETIESMQESVLFGEQGEIKEIKVGLEYRVPGSSATFYVEQKYEVEISSSPITLVVVSPLEVNSGQEVEFEIDLVANSDETIENVLFVADFPFGFEFVSSSPEPTFDDDVWNIGDFAPESKRSIRIRGKVFSEDNEEHVFKFTVGIESKDNEKKIETPFIVQTKTLAIAAPFIDLGVAVNGDSSPSVSVIAGSPVRVDISWENQLSTTLSDVVIEAKIIGNIFVPRDVSVKQGFFRSTDNTVVFDAKSFPALAAVGPGQGGSNTFSFPLIEIGQLTGTKINPTMSVEVSVKARQFGSSGAPTVVANALSRTVAVSTNIFLTSQGSYYTGPFTNNGPIPPRVNNKTTYTVTWAISNGLNDAESVEVTSKIPQYIEWLGVISPQGEDVTYNPIGGTIVWRPGKVEAGAGYTKSLRQLSFQVSLIPSITQLGGTPLILENVTMTGKDSFTGVPLSGSRQGITTFLKSEPNFDELSGRVVQ